MPPKDKDEPAIVPEVKAKSEHQGIALQARELAEKEGITVAAAAERLQKVTNA